MTSALNTDEYSHNFGNIPDSLVRGTESGVRKQSGATGARLGECYIFFIAWSPPYSARSAQFGSAAATGPGSGRHSLFFVFGHNFRMVDIAPIVRAKATNVNNTKSILLFLLIAILVGGCKKIQSFFSDSSPSDHWEYPQKSAPGYPPDAFDAVSSRQTDTVETEFAPVTSDESATSDSDDERLALLQAELNSYRLETVHPPLPESPADRRMLTHLLKASQLVDDIYALQVHGNNLIWRNQIRLTGEPIEKQFMMWFRRPWCRLNRNPRCNVIASLPLHRTGTVFWPVDFDEAELVSAGRMINARELFSPFGLVVRDGGTRLRAVPYVEDSRFSDLFRQLSDAFRQAGASLENTADRDALYALADAVMAGDMNHLGMQQQESINLSAGWRIHFGGFSASVDPFGKKRALEFSVMKRDSDIQSVLDFLMRQQDGLQQSFSQLFGDRLPWTSLSVGGNWNGWRVWLNAGAGADPWMESVWNFEGVGKSGDFVLYAIVDSLMPYVRMLNESEESLLSLSAWATMVGAVNIAARLVPPESAAIGTDTEFITVGRFLGEKTDRVLAALGLAGSFWVLQQINPRGDSDSSVFIESARALIANVIYALKNDDENGQRASTWLLQRLSAPAETELAGVFNAAYTAEMLSVGAMLFEQLVHAISAGNPGEIDRLIPEEGKGENAMEGRTSLVSLIERKMKPFPQPKPAIFHFIPDLNAGETTMAELREAGEN